jgi:hypothetical protein
MENLNKLNYVFMAVATICLFIAGAMLVIWFLLATSSSSLSALILPIQILWGLAFLTGFISLILNCKFYGGSAKILYSVLIVSITVLAVPAGIAGELYAGARARMQLVKMANLQRVGSELLKYAKSNNNRLPLSENWCDALTQYNPEITRLLLKRSVNESPEIKNRCYFVFNKNLSGCDINSISSKVILLFEADGKWNLSGTSELLQKEATGIFLLDGYVGVFLLDGHVRMYTKKSKDANGEILWK